MMLRYKLAFLLQVLLSTFSFAQPTPCDDPPEMTSFCMDACIICDIDGFEGRHESTIIGQSPPGFAGECTFVAHNMQWIAFIAGSTNLTVELSVSNCEQNIGLEFGLYKGNNCENFQRISNCFGGAAGIVGPGDNGAITNTEPLVIGQYYFIVMDGGLGDNCDWSFNVLSGSTQVDPLTTSGIIEGNSFVCPGKIEQFFVDAPMGATEFAWTVDGATAGENAPVLNYTFPSVGTYTVCVTSSNACDEGPATCRQIQAISIPVTELQDVLCEGDTFVIADTLLAAGGFYEFDLISLEGCDSLVTLELTEIVTPLLNLDVSICQGDTLIVGNTPYTLDGSYQEILESVDGCDSIVDLNLFTIVCNINSTDLVTPVRCHGESSGSIEFVVTNGTAPFTYAWQELNATMSGSGVIGALGTTSEINNLPLGTYVITINDNFGNSDILISTVEQPEALSLELLPSDYNGVNVTCFDSNDGMLTANVEGGITMYSYSWDNLALTESIEELSPGNYAVTITDARGCTIADSYELTSPDELLLIGEFRDPDCTGLSTGVITAVQTLGGAGAYTFSLDATNFSEEQVFDELPEGAYTLTVQDGNGCTDELTGTLIAPQIPDITMEDDFEVELGDQISLNPMLNGVSLDTINWISDELLSCYDCLEPDVIPLNDAIYSLAIQSVDGCVDTASISIKVNKFRKIYVPNVFSPNFDGVNDRFTIYGGREVASIVKFRIFNRWGALVFNAENIDDGVELLGWDGTFKGQDMDPGVFAWMAELLFIDGKTLQYSGDILLIK